ncbi:hypothetical protein [Flavobacterium sp. J27]|uniref:hypothetical protein n=1 Tax=Flavobacterium sp. J27 TaxID=2060419 RepID=UPI00103024AA|nr:hypothetical protein [Flavobacterium sp. J27]
MKNILKILSFFVTVAFYMYFVFFLFMVLSCIVSCKSKQPVKEIHTVEKTIEKQKDSTSVTKISNAIIDSLKVKIAEIKTAKPECDSITNAKIQELLSQIEVSKTSGDNEIGFYYDQIKKMLVAYAKTGQSTNKETNTNNVTKETEKDNLIKEIPVQFTPKWVKILAGLGVLFIIFLVWRFSKIFR